MSFVKVYLICLIRPRSLLYESNHRGCAFFPPAFSLKAKEEVSKFSKSF